MTTPTETQRRCSECSAPITKYSATGKCRTCAAHKFCVRCEKPARPGSDYCARCKAHQDLPMRSHGRRPTPAQAAWQKTTSVRLSTLKRATPIEGPCTHRWAVPSLPTDIETHSYHSTCSLCGAEKDFRPFEDAPRESVRGKG